MKISIAAPISLLLAACATTTVLGEVQPPLDTPVRAYDAAALVTLPERAPSDSPGLHHVYALSDNIVSGAEPEGRAAFASLAERGIRTIVSVDGATPDHELAAEFGMRYVHVPIRYSGIEQGELTALTKTFRELEGPFFVHCFHGKHRGPAAAAVGRLTLDSVDRRVALAEMRQWSGTSEKYDGLYSAVAFAELPDPATTSRFEFDFPAAHAFDGFREAMVHMAREHDVLIALADRGWEAHPDHPDWDGRNAATKLADILAQTHTMQEVLDEDSEYQGWLVSSEQMSRQIADLLGRVDQGDREAAAPAAKLVGELKNTCNRCHSGYRN